MTEKNYVVNVKTTLGTIITVRGDSAEELATNIGGLVSQGVNEHVGALEELFLGKGNAPVVNSAVATVTQALGGEVIAETKFAPKTPPTGGAPAVGGKTCVHGNMVKRTGQGAKGEWRGFFCPTPKGTEGQCSPVFARQGSPDWSSF